MAEHKSVYLWSLQEAQKLNEVDLWRESYKENCTCARAIEQCIDENYADNRLNTDAAKGIIDRFGFNRVNWVLANTIQRKDFDGRISQATRLGQELPTSLTMIFVGTMRLVPILG